ncbi:CubicO group peptidase (beta-lactamase class C family) [Arthrobacter sp. SLBN-100]|uniref:serine hydrolase domain-containing protein n=1 Tax=Arthrobacter sp. SLBN-100 TaxID=2768450 RepID=UPI001174C4B2|nr:serine hydrolase domain-containing protein [Arthrobacter sp. SLBN-100]TQJ66369.1 CubicO group peptidase (beta-lactamase class C family) [Arthrobacter sp. SLBN-100]
MATAQIPPPTGEPGPIDEVALRAKVAGVLNSWPSAGLAVAVVRDGRLAWFHGHGVAEVATGKPVTEDTVFRVGSLTKTVTAVAVMQLWERGLVDLDAPANDYLTTFRLAPVRQGLQPATVRHLLTHTGGVGYWRRMSDLLRPALGSGVRATRVLPLSDYYRRGLPQEIQPGTKWAYSNHGFAALGQIVEDVTGQTLADYMREHVFDPLGMDNTGLVRSDRVRPGMATRYVVRPRGLIPVAEYEMPTPGGGGLYSTAADMGRYVASLLQEGAADRRQLLQPSTVAMMFQPHFQPDPRVPGAGLGFSLDSEGGHRTVAKNGVLSGFLADLAMAPGEGIGVVVLTNTGALSGQGAAVPLGTAVLRQLLRLPDEALRTDLAPHAEVWADLCGWYSPAPGPVTNLFTRLLLGAGVEVLVLHNQLIMKPLTPLPAMRKGMRLHPDDPNDPCVFRVDMSDVGLGTMPVVFTGARNTGNRQLLMDVMAFQKRPDARNPRRLATAALAAGAATLTVLHGLRSRPAAGSPSAH